MNEGPLNLDGMAFYDHTILYKYTICLDNVAITMLTIDVLMFEELLFLP